MSIQEQNQCADLRAKGKTRKQIASIMGIKERRVKYLLELSRARDSIDPYVMDGLDKYGVKDLRGVDGGWLIKQDGEGGRLSLRFKVDGGEGESIIDSVSSAFESIEPYTPKHSDPIGGDFATVYPLYDMHAGMHAWGRETRSQDYDLKLMKSDLVESVNRVSSMSPPSDHAIVIFGGDTIHVNDAKNETPGSGHKMDADGRYEKIIDMTIEAITNAIELLCERHAKVSVYVIRGNHDEQSHIVLKAALKQRYREDENINFPTIDEWDKSEIYWVRHGKTLIVMHHGDKCKPERLAMIAADKCPHWSSTTHRMILTGHLHHLRVQDFPGVTHYTLRAFCPPDAYGAMFGGSRGLQAMTICKNKGLVLQAHDPIDRE